MTGIGQRIKDLRKKADMTQDRLADYLGVSPQAVSKWECDISTPDLSLIAPLCKVLGCSADELLGIGGDDEEAGAREKEVLARVSHNAPETAGLSARELFPICLAAVEEYPRNLWMHYYCAMTESCLCGKVNPTEEEAREKREHWDAAERRYLFILGETEDEELRACVYNNLVFMLVEQGRMEEAAAYARKCPTNGKVSADYLLLACLEGEEGERHWQEYVTAKLEDLLLALMRRTESLPAMEAVEAVVRVMFPDGNYLGWFNYLHDALEYQTELLAKAGRYDEAVKKLAEYCAVCKKLDEVNARDGETIAFTAPLFDRLSDTMPFLGSVYTTTEYAGQWLNMEWFEPLREREDFKALCAEMQPEEKI